MKILLALCLLLVTGSTWAATPPTAAPLPADSIYQLDVQLTDQDGHRWPLAARRGQVQVVSMFYTSCTMVCPLIIQTMQATAKAAGPVSPALLAVSFDPQNDDPGVLHRYAQTHGLDAAHWTLARAEPDDVRRLAALLGIRYRRLPEGDFNHSSVLILIDADGRILARSTVIGHPDPAFVQAVRQALAAAKPPGAA